MRTPNIIIMTPASQISKKEPQRGEGEKVHSTAFARKVKLLILKWRYQRLRDKAWQVIFLMYLILMLSSSTSLHSALSLGSHATINIDTRPRCVQVEFNDGFPTPTTEEGKLENSRFGKIIPMSKHSGMISSQSDPGEETFRSFEEGSCKAMHDWQIQYYPDCNRIHEIDLNKRSTRLINNGGFRDVWSVSEPAYEDHQEPFVMKTLIYKKKVKFREIDRHRRDANTYAMLQSSIHIPDIYGSCSNTALFDLAPNGTMEDMIYDDKKVEMSKWTAEHRLQYSWQVAKAMTELHSVGNIHDSAAISHTDVSTDQFLWVNGMFKLNDFNRARFIRWNARKEEPCKFIVGKNPGKNRSPEEYKDHEPLNEKIDIYSMGNIFYSILMGEKVFEGINYMKKDKVYKEVQKGVVPIIPQAIIDGYGPLEKVVLEAMRMCHVYNPDDRSRASDVETFLKAKLEEHNVSEF